MICLKMLVEEKKVNDIMGLRSKLWMGIKVEKKKLLFCPQFGRMMQVKLAS